MPRFFLDITEGDQHFSDEIGDEFPNLNRAEREAVCVAASLAREEVSKDGVSAYEVLINVRDERGESLATAKASVRIERSDPLRPMSRAD